ncbi:MAG: hypothetical protein RLZZ74_1340, partial [Cyanobacteriota bacterium]
RRGKQCYQCRLCPKERREANPLWHMDLDCGEPLATRYSLMDSRRSQ